MNKKMGKSRLLEKETKGVLIGARFSPPEARVVEDAARRSQKVKSEWVRQMLLLAAGATPSWGP
jgi:hypothetical protein